MTTQKQAELIAQVNDPSCETVGPFVKGEETDELLEWLWQEGIVINEFSDQAVVDEQGKGEA
jgi:hypothetical protein